MNPLSPLPAVQGAATAAPVRAPFLVIQKTLEPAASSLVPASVLRREPSATQGSSLPGALRDLEGVRARLDSMLSEARRGRTFSPQELLCLQADAHRFAQSVEFTARAVEHGVQGLRQAFNAQV